jgi:hypothetical protein
LAAENLRRYKTDSRQCTDATCVLGDAAQFAFPPEPTVLYFYNPFQGGVMDRVIANLKKSLQDHPRCLDFLREPVGASKVQAQPGIRSD